jgi:toxin ParE1/3/4
MMRIRWTEPAVRDFTHIYYIQEHGSTATARRIALAIYKSIGTLTDYPEIGWAGRKPNTRELVLSGLPYIAIYRLREQTVEVLRILHGAQKWP